MKVAGSIYRFSYLIQGIVVENSAARYTIVATKPVIEQVTSSFKVLPLIEWIKKDTMYSVNIGIGMGETLSAAYHNASRAQLRTKGQEGDNIILVYADGMMSSISVESAEQTEGSYEDRLRQIAKDCEVPFAMVSKLYRFAEGWPYKQFSATDVSKELGIAKRTTDRFLAKLEAAGYITVTARPLTGERGRPSRMMQVSYKKLR